MTTTTFIALSSQEDGGASDEDPHPHSILGGRGVFATLKHAAARLICAHTGAEPPDDPDNPPPVISAQQNQLLANVRRLSERRVSDAMVPRADIIAIDETADMSETLAAFRDARHSRLPVYRETLDDVLGFVHVKDLLLTYGVDGPQAPCKFRLESHIRDAIFVPASVKAAILLEKMQISRTHMAFVIDEHGGVDGLVTIEDLIEEVVGDISDEYDDAEEDEWTRSPNGLYDCSARADLSEFEKEIRVKLIPEDSEEEIETLGGLVLLLCQGRMPQPGEVVKHPDGHEFSILDADPRRLKRLAVTLATSARRPLALPSPGDSAP